MNSLNLSQQLDWFYQLQRHGIKLGLDHTTALLKSFQNPQDDLTMIHVAGTNGKGSTCAQIANILKYAGYKVGLYTSPHLVRFNERIRVNGAPISDDEIASFIRKAKSSILEIESTFFEATTTMALDHFRNHKVDVAVIETGLGGRLDSTNVIHPVLTVMTPISMDHMDILGDTLGIIAKEKAGIIKDSIPLISAHQHPEVKSILNEKVNQLDAMMQEMIMPTQIEITEKGTNFNLSGDVYNTALIGKHQALNAALAIQTIQKFDNSISKQIIEKGLKTVHWPGRLEKLDYRVYYDVAHNEDGLDTLIRTMKSIYPKKPISGIFGLKGDKDLKRIAQKMKGQLEQVITVKDKHDLLLDVEFVSSELKNYGVNCTPGGSIKDTIPIVHNWQDDGQICIIFGSHYIAEEVYNQFEIPFDKGVI